MTVRASMAGHSARGVRQTAEGRFTAGAEAQAARRNGGGWTDRAAVEASSSWSKGWNGAANQHHGSSTVSLLPTVGIQKGPYVPVGSLLRSVHFPGAWSRAPDRGVLRSDLHGSLHGVATAATAGSDRRLTEPATTVRAPEGGFMQCRHRRAATLVAAAVTTMAATAFLAGRQAIPEYLFMFVVGGRGGSSVRVATLRRRRARAPSSVRRRAVSPAGMAAVARRSRRHHGLDRAGCPARRTMD